MPDLTPIVFAVCITIFLTTIVYSIKTYNSNLDKINSEICEKSNYKLCDNFKKSVCR